MRITGTFRGRRPRMAESSVVLNDDFGRIRQRTAEALHLIPRMKHLACVHGTEKAATSSTYSPKIMSMASSSQKTKNDLSFLDHTIQVEHTRPHVKNQEHRNLRAPEQANRLPPPHRHTLTSAPWNRNLSSGHDSSNTLGLPFPFALNSTLGTSKGACFRDRYVCRIDS